jgi:hypothetical protein
MADSQFKGTYTGDFSEDPAKEGFATVPLDPLALDIEDGELAENIDARIKASHDFYDAADFDLYTRRETNELYYFGRQIVERERKGLIKPYESRFQDNVLYEIEATLKPLAMTRFPDLLVTPGNDSEESVLMADELSKAIDTDIKERDNRRVLGMAFKHLPVYFMGCIKAIWNPEIDDYQFLCIHPSLIEVDHTSPSNDANEMDWVAQTVPMTVMDITLKFPDKKEALYKKLQSEGLMVGETPSWHLLATQLKTKEVWFTWKKRHKDTQAEIIEGVAWKYKDLILDKMRNPNFDYEGETRYFAYDTKNNGEASKRALNTSELNQILMTGQLPDHIKKEQVYHNYFDHPEKPFYFLGYDQWGRQPMDETSRIEQNIQNQKSLDRRGKQIDETLANRGHHIFSKTALTPANVEELDLAEPNLDLSVDGNPKDVYMFIEPERPTPQEFEEMEKVRTRMYAIAGSTATRGQIQSQVATTNQIAREADFTRADDLVEDTINGAAQWMARTAMQFIKLRYTKDHFRKLMGVAGDVIFVKLNRNMVDEGMLIKMKASGTDKIRAQNNALEAAKLQMTDPYSYNKDMGFSDPEGRTEKLILLKADPMAYLQKVNKNIDTSAALAQALMSQQINPQPNPQQNPTPPMNASGQVPLAQGATQPPAPGAQPGGIPAAPSSANTAQVPISPSPQPPQGSVRNL